MNKEQRPCVANLGALKMSLTKYCIIFSTKIRFIYIHHVRVVGVGSVGGCRVDAERRLRSGWKQQKNNCRCQNHVSNIEEIVSAAHFKGRRFSYHAFINFSTRGLSLKIRVDSDTLGATRANDFGCTSLSAYCTKKATMQLKFLAHLFLKP